MSKLTVFIVIFIGSFAMLFLSATTIQLVGAIASLVVSGVFFVMTYAELRTNELTADDLYDRSAE